MVGGKRLKAEGLKAEMFERAEMMKGHTKRRR
jgi:hypothetical protein